MDKLILYLIGSFFVIGAIDYITGNHLKLGGKFEEGIKTMGLYDRENKEFSLKENGGISNEY